MLLATNEALEVRGLRRGCTETLQLREPEDRGLVLKWRRENMQVTAAAFIAQGNMLVVSDRGDRLLLLNCIVPLDSIQRASATRNFAWYPQLPGLAEGPYGTQTYEPSPGAS